MTKWPGRGLLIHQTSLGGRRFSLVLHNHSSRSACTWVSLIANTSIAIVAVKSRGKISRHVCDHRRSVRVHTRHGDEERPPLWLREVLDFTWLGDCWTRKEHSTRVTYRYRRSLGRRRLLVYIYQPQPQWINGISGNAAVMTA